MAATAKQQAFARGIISGLNPSEAYRAAGYKAANSATVATEAQRLLNNPHIAPIIESGKQEAMKTAVWCRAMALERVQAANDALYRKIEGGEMTRDVLRAFLDSAAMLNDLSDIDHEKQLRREVITEETSEVRTGGMFDFSDMEGEIVQEGKSRREALEMFVALQ